MKLLIFILLLLATFSCSKTNVYTSFSVIETNGISREMEYIEVAWEMPTKPNNDSNFSISGNDGNRAGQILEVVPNKEKYKVTGLFPVSIEAHQIKNYNIIALDSEPMDTLLNKGTNFDLKIENNHFIADLTKNPINTDSSLTAGQLRALSIKNESNTYLKRSGINMHWSPNFQSTGREYRTSSHITNLSYASVETGRYLTTLVKEGKVSGYPEITLKTSYEFYAGTPYFVYSSEVLIEKEIELYLLRNDEMTLDSIFTQIIYPDPKQGVLTLPLFKSSTFKELKNNPIKQDVPWLTFFNPELQLGYGCIRLEYNNTNLKGAPSPLYLPHTKITAVNSDGGRYWNRRLIHEKNTLIPKGSRYYEKNLYFIIKDRSDLEDVIDGLLKRINNPLKVVYH